MEYRINKIDTDIRDRMKEKVKIDKVHPNDNATIKKDIKDDDNNSNLRKDKNNKKKKHYTIEGIKYSEPISNIEVEAEMVDNIYKNENNGRILDTLK